MQFKKTMRLFFLLGGLVATNAFSADAHIWQTVASLNGTWDVRLQMINEGGTFVTRDGAFISEFSVTPTQSQEYGFNYDSKDDFNVAYTITATEHTAHPAFSSKACVFIVTALSPGQPDLRVAKYNGATCEWKNAAKGGQFFVS